LKKPTPTPEKAEKTLTNHFALNIAGKLESMSKRQRIFAEKRINDVIFEIEMGEFETRVSTNNTETTSTLTPFFPGHYNVLHDN